MSDTTSGKFYERQVVTIEDASGSEYVKLWNKSIPASFEGKDVVMKNVMRMDSKDKEGNVFHNIESCSNFDIEVW